MNKIAMTGQAGAGVPAVIAAEGNNVLDRLVQAWTVSKQCGVAIRQLKVEEHRINMEFKTQRQKIKAETKVRLKALREDRLRFEKQLDLNREMLSQMMADRSRVLDLIVQAQRDNQYEFAAQCARLLPDLRMEPVRLLNLLGPAPEDDIKQIGGE